MFHFVVYVFMLDWRIYSEILTNKLIIIS